MDGLKSAKNPKTLVATGSKKGEMGWWMAKSRLVLLKLAGILHSKGDKCVISRGGGGTNALLQGFQLVITNSEEAKSKGGGEKKIIFSARVAQMGKAIHIQGIPQRGQDDGFNQQICQKNTLRDTEKVIKNTQVCTNTKETFINR